MYLEGRRKRTWWHKTPASGEEGGLEDDSLVPVSGGIVMPHLLGFSSGINILRFRCQSPFIRIFPQFLHYCLYTLFTFMSLRRLNLRQQLPCRRDHSSFLIPTSF